MEELVINKPYAEIIDLGNRAQVLNLDSVRTYKSSPTDAVLQIRTLKPITPKGKARKMVATVHLSKAECLEMAEYLRAVAAKLR